MKKKLVMLAIMDGYGLREEKYGNAIYEAKTPNLDFLFKNYPNIKLGASGFDVGLPNGQMGNSEVGHLNIGAGRVVYQSYTRVDLAVKEDKLIKVNAIAQAINHSINNGSKLHIMGLLSDGGVHSHMSHMFYLIEKAVALGVKDVIVHAFLDGRDVPPSSAIEYLETLKRVIAKAIGSRIGVVSGRYYAMDRDKNYNRVQLAYDALVHNKGSKNEAIQGIKDSYLKGITDEFVIPFITSDNSNIENNDAVIFANFRPDRAIEIATAITNIEKTTIKGGKKFDNLLFVSMMPYSENVKGLVAFDTQDLNNIYGEVIAKNNLKQLRIAETEKYAHVTYFFDGGVERDFPGVKRILIPSPKVATYDLMPEMSAYEVCNEVVKAIESKEFDTIILNFANCDMVGHTAVKDSVIKAVEVVDECMGKVYKAIKNVDGILLVTADHGNADKILDENGKPFSAHTTSPVPFILVNCDKKLESCGNLGDIAPTMLELLGINKPVEMTGKSLIKK
ncbi:MAG: 2,3-bisphosphoglycerate-independent phosphoglycerate mutase [Bacilli bacterium]|nr:2,3-bisphosphoglycerate-independent phosphoglycerate mutase [Bacilli bacterium]